MPRHFWTLNVPPRNTSAGLLRVTNPTFAFFPAAAVNSIAGFPTNAYNKYQAYWDSRASLKLDMIMGPNLSGTIIFEIDSMQWGSGPNGERLAGLATTGAGSGGGVGYWTTDRTAVEVKNVYIDFGLPYFGIPVPITVRVGAQPIGLRPHILVYTDGMGVTAATKVDPVMVSFIYAKPVEGLNWSSDDSDVYGLHLNAKLGTVTLGGYGLWYNMNTYPFWCSSALAGFPANLFFSGPRDE